MDVQEIDRLCDEFERCVRGNLSLCVEEFLGDVEFADNEELIIELLRIEDELIRDKVGVSEASRSTHGEDAETQSPLAAKVAMLRTTRDSKKSSESTIHVTGEVSEPRSISGFRLLEEVGRGAYGSVWKAYDAKLDRHVAVKLPRKEQLSDRETELFLREARSAAQLRHPSIVGVHEAGLDPSGQLYIVSDFIDGGNLAERLRDRTLETTDAIGLMICLCDAVQHAHDHGVIHRDLKPQNILLDGNGTPHITDFGLAKREMGETTMTMDGDILGTPAYMSPEQAAGQARQVDGRADIYSLGVILFQLLTSELPFRGSIQMLIHQILSEAPSSPRKLDSTISRDLETICLKCLEKDKERRYSNAHELRDDLQRVIDGVPIGARPVGPIRRLTRWYCRNVSVIAPAAFLVTVLMLSASVLGTAAVALATSTDLLNTNSLALILISILFPMIGIALGRWAMKGSRIASCINTVLIAMFFTGSIINLFMRSLRLSQQDMEVELRGTLGTAAFFVIWEFGILLIHFHALTVVTQSKSSAFSSPSATPPLA